MKTDEPRPTRENRNRIFDNYRSAEQLRRAGVAAAVLTAFLLIALILRQKGPGPVIAVLPWFIPVISLFNSLILLSVAILAIGRAKVLRDAASFWIGLGAIGFSVAMTFYALAWPGLLPNGEAIIGGIAGASTWVLQIGLTLFSTFLLLAVILRKPNNELASWRLAILAAGWLLVLAIAFTGIVRAVPYLPALITPTGFFSRSFTIWNAVLAILLVSGAVLSTRRFLKTGDALLGYIAIAQIGFGVAMIVALSGMRRYDLTWYLTRAIPTGSSMVVLFGLLFDYVQLIGREKEKTSQVSKAEKGLRQSNQALRESEDRYRSLFKNNHAVMLLIEPSSGQIIEANTAACAYYGYTLDEITRLKITDINMLSPELVHAEMQRARAEQHRHFFFQHRLSDGRIRDVEVFSGPIPVKGRKLLYSIVHDITERKRMEETLKLMNENLEQRVAERTALAEARAKQLQSLAVSLIETEERERHRFAHLLHDDLQQMLAAAKMQLQAVAGSPPSQQDLVDIEHIVNESILTSRRLSHELSPPILHHTGLVAGLQWLSNQMTERFGLQVDFEASADGNLGTPFKVLMFRAAQELLFNTVKHAKVKRARVALFESDGDLVLAVADQGKGFDPETLHFSDATAGLGLISLQERTNAIGGSLTIESEPGKGSRFTLRLPFDLVKNNESREPAAENQPDDKDSRPHEFDSTKTRVLFADDHKVMRQGLIRLIAGQPDIQVVGEAANGKEALIQTRRLQPDVVVMDVSMPEMDGVEATLRIKAEMPEIRIIGLSMYEDEQIVRSMREAGAEIFVSKTASSAELLKAIYGLHDSSQYAFL